MAITLDATVGGANANTYITLADANSFIEGLVLSDDAAAWDGSSNDNKNRALFTAAQRIDREKFLGARVDDTQALEWPRSGVRKPDTYTNLYGLSFPRGTKGPQRKKMVIEAVKEKEKTAFTFEMARGGKNYKKGTDDRADAVVIARAGEFILKNQNNKGFLTEKIILTE